MNINRIRFSEVNDRKVKSAICDRILHALPDWFGIESSIADYVEQVAAMPFFAAFDGEDAVGFVAIKMHNPHTAELCVMGICREYHRLGIGRSLVKWCVSHCRQKGMTFLTVKTLAESADSKEYARTRAFYLAMGFRPLEVFPLLWDESNPCLFMAMPVADGCGAV